MALASAQPAGNSIDFFVQGLGLSFHRDMNQIIGWVSELGYRLYRMAIIAFNQLNVVIHTWTIIGRANLLPWVG